MKFFFGILLAVCLNIPAGYSQAKYPCDSIPGVLRIGADAVVRSCEKKLNLVSEKKAVIDFKIALTLLNGRAEKFIYVSLPYDKLSGISRINASAYDENGNLVWVLKKDEIYDVNGFTGPEYLDDSRMKLFKFPSYNYPYTIEYSCVYNTENPLFNPSDDFHTDSRISVEKSGIQYIIPRGVPFKYKSVNLKSPTDSMQVKNKLIFTWQEENIPAKKQYPFAPAIYKAMPTLYTKAEHFSFGGFPGDMSSWKSLGMWEYKMIEGRDLLGKEETDKVLALIKNVHDSREKIRILYEYMQGKTRYFYVGFGMGGYQPVMAEHVAENGYGDCKALSNYMKALLKVAGIESYYTLVQAGYEIDINPDFPSNQFNHVILCVPDKKDTIWLECTNQTNPFGYLGSFTADRHVLVVTPEGGKLQRTPSYDKQDNIVNTYAEISLYGSGDADIKIKLHNKGLFYEDLKAASESLEDNRKDVIARLLDYPTFNLKKEEYTFGKTDVPYGIAKYDIHIRDLSSKGGNRLFITPALLAKFHYLLKAPVSIELSKSYQQNDTVRIAIPLGFKIEYLPDDLQVNSRFGKYTSHISGDDKYVYFTRNLEMNKAVYPKESYPEFYEFMNKIAANDHQMLILKATNN